MNNFPELTCVFFIHTTSNLDLSQSGIVLGIVIPQNFTNSYKDFLKLYLDSNRNISFKNSLGIFLSKHVLQLRLSLLIKT